MRPERSKRVTKLSSRCPFNTFRQVHFIHLRWEGNNLSCDSFSNREGCTAGTTGSESAPEVHRNCHWLKCSLEIQGLEGTFDRDINKNKEAHQKKYFCGSSLSHKQQAYLRAWYSPFCKCWL